MNLRGCGLAEPCPTCGLIGNPGCRAVGCPDDISSDFDDCRIAIGAKEYRELVEDSKDNENLKQKLSKIRAIVKQMSGYLAPIYINNICDAMLEILDE